MDIEPNEVCWGTCKSLFATSVTAPTSVISTLLKRFFGPSYHLVIGKFHTLFAALLVGWSLTRLSMVQQSCVIAWFAKLKKTHRKRLFHFSHRLIMKWNTIWWCRKSEKHFVLFNFMTDFNEKLRNWIIICTRWTKIKGTWRNWLNCRSFAKILGTFFLYFPSPSLIVEREWVRDGKWWFRHDFLVVLKWSGS